MKNFRDYLSESEQAAENPVTGDTFAVNIREECLVESVVLEHAEDGIVIAADEKMLEIFESYGITVEDVCMECGMTESGCGCTHESEQVDEFAAGMLARAALPFAAGAAVGAIADDDANEARDPGEYDTEGDMAKNELLTIIRAARKLTGMLDNDDNMPEWTQKKITKAADYVDTAADYISSQKERGVMEQGVAEDFDVEAAREKLASLKRELKSVTGNYPGDQRNRMLFRRQIFDLKAQIKAAGGKKSGVAEGSEDVSPVARAVLHRIMMAHPGVLATHGPERVMSAVDELADRVNIGPDDEIGSSDVSGWTRDVIRMLAEMPDESMSDVDRLAEGPVSGEIDDSWMNDKHKEFYKRNPHFKRNNRDRVEVGNRLATQVKPLNPQQVQKKPAAGFGMGEATEKTNARGLTQQQWMAAVRKKYPDAQIIQAKMPNGPMHAFLPGGKKISWIAADVDSSHQQQSPKQSIQERGVQDQIKNRLQQAIQKILDPIEYQHQQDIRQQDREYERAIGTEARADLKQKADELAEIKRQQLRAEALEDAELAFQRAETRAEREAVMEKIKREYQHELDVINTNHRANMEAIRTGNDHEIRKMEREHGHEKDMWNLKNPSTRDRVQRPARRPNVVVDLDIDQPEPAAPDTDAEYQQSQQDMFRLSGIPLPAPAQQKKPKKFDTTGAVDADVKEPDDKRPGAPGLPGPTNEAEYQGRDVPLGKPMRGDVAKFKVYVKDPKTGNVKKVNFGDPNMRIKKSDPARRKSFRARHNCDTAKDRTTARYWSCRKW